MIRKAGQIPTVRRTLLAMALVTVLRVVETVVFEDDRWNSTSAPTFSEERRLERVIAEEQGPQQGIRGSGPS